MIALWKKLVSRSSYAIVPVRESSKAKTRLASILGREERRKLTLTMLRDVLDALYRTRRLDHVVLVTRDARAARVARARGAQILREDRSRGLNPAARHAIRFADRKGARQVLIVPCDVPLAKATDFERMLKAAHTAEVVIVPSHDGGGTNALLLRPPSIMPVSYGRDSFTRHCRLARKRGLSVRILKPRSLRLDIDNPADLTRLRLRHGGTQSQKLLRTLFG